MKLPTKAGHVEITETSGRCVVDGCPLKGGGLVRVREIVGAGKALPAWDGRAVVLCGPHLTEALSAVFRTE